MKKLEADVAVVAAGAAGLAATVAAVQRGAKVITLEKGSTTGGAASMGMGPLGVESRRQRLMMSSLTRDEAFKQFMNYTHWRVDARLVRAYIDKSGDTINWLEKLAPLFSNGPRWISEGTWSQGTFSDRRSLSAGIVKTLS